MIFKKYTLVKFSFVAFIIFNVSFVYANPISITQIDVGSTTAPIPFNEAHIDEGGKVILNNGDSVFYGYSKLDNGAYRQIYYYDHSTELTNPISVSSSGGAGNGDSYSPVISSDGRYISYYSDASNLVTSDINGYTDVFLYNIQSRSTTLVSKSTEGVQGESGSYYPSISSDGRYISYSSEASNFVAGDANGVSDIFLYDTESGETTLVSKSTAGTHGDDSSYYPSVSNDGRYVSYYSSASNLVAGDTNGYSDTFLYDTELGTTTLVSKSTGGVHGNNNSYNPSISGDSRYILYYSDASNLIISDTNSYGDIFLYNIESGATSLISKSTEGVQGNGPSSSPSVSNDGRYISYYSSASNLVAGDINSYFDIFLYDTESGTTTLVSKSDEDVQGDSDSFVPSISNNGRYILYQSNASNLVRMDTNDSSDIFLYDTELGTTTLISNYYTTKSYDSGTDNTDNYRNNISADNRYVVFHSQATNIVSGVNDANTYVFLRDVELGTTTLVSKSTEGVKANSGAYFPSISNDGKYVTYHSDASNLVANDTNNFIDIFLYNIQSGTTTLVSKSTEGIQGDNASYSASISSDGRYVTYYSDATNLVIGDINGYTDVFLYDTQLEITTLISKTIEGVQGDNTSHSSSISSDGRYVSYSSDATNLVAGDINRYTDVFLYDTQLGTTTLISKSTEGVQGNSGSYSPSISSDGRYVSYYSNSINLTSDEVNGSYNTFLYDTQLGTTTLISKQIEGGISKGIDSYPPSISSDGRYISYYSDSPDLVLGDTNRSSDVFLYDTQSGITTRVSVSVTGEEGDDNSSYSSISPDGSFVGFTSYATNLIDGVTGVGGGNYFLAKVIEEPEPEETPRSHSRVIGSSVGSITLFKVEQQTHPVLQPTTPIIEITIPTPTPTEPTLSITRLLKLNMMGDDVKELQIYLNNHGFLVALIGSGSKGNETNKFGPLTKKAVIAFQKANGLVADGIVGSKTLNKMK